MPEIDVSKPIEDLKVELARLKEAVSAVPTEWNAKKAVVGTLGECARSHWQDQDKPASLIAIGDKKFCEEHFKYSASEARRELETSIGKLESELTFRQTVEKAHRFKDIKSMVDAVKVILKKSSGYYGDKDPFTAEDKEQGRKLLQILDKIKPESSPFLDRGVAVNQDLYLAGEIESRRTTWDEARFSTPTVLITALDRDERYKSIARVGLTIGEAERLRNLLVECIEHVRIARMMKEIQDKMKISLSQND